MQIKEIQFKKKKALSLENSEVRLVVIPEIGGKIVSFYNKEKSFELLFQNKEEEYKKPSYGDNFAEYDCSGFDDCFPNIDSSKLKYNGSTINYADHGEIWSADFDYQISDDKLILSYYSQYLDYNYQKKIHLEANKVKIDYRIENQSEKALPAIWAMHCLINYSQDMELNFPTGVDKIENVMESKYLGKKGEFHKFPITVDKFNNLYRLNRVNNNEETGCEKYYVRDKVKLGQCSAFYPQEKIEFIINFEQNKLPYLGFWLTEGGFKNDYNCAFEPADGYYDSVNTALENEKINIIKAGESYNFALELELK
jgi:galactose mutarotase-like enzyme